MKTLIPQSWLSFSLQIPPYAKRLKTAWLIKKNHTAKTRSKIDIRRGAMLFFYKLGAKSEPRHQLWAIAWMEWASQTRCCYFRFHRSQKRSEKLVDLIATAALLYLCRWNRELDTFHADGFHPYPGIYISLNADFFFFWTGKPINVTTV